MAPRLSRTTVHDLFAHFLDGARPSLAEAAPKLMNIVLLAGIVINVLTAIPVVMQLRNHPRGLVVLFFTEMWERFSYYGMRALLIYYLTQHFLFEDKDAAAQYGAYTTLIYLMPLIGGILADRFLGTRKAILFGAVLLTIGQLCLAIEGPQARQVLTYQGHAYAFQVEGRASARHARLRVGNGAYDFAADKDGGLDIKGLPAASPLPATLAKGSYGLTVEKRNPLFLNVFYLALSLIIIGVGYLKANVASIAGQLYPLGDPRRDSGFTLYYYGMNLGAFWSAIVCGLVGQTVGWWAGFGLGGLGMMLGLLVFLFGKGQLQGKGGPPAPEKLKQPLAGPLKLEGGLYLLGLLGVALVFLLLRHNAIVGTMLAIGSVLVLGYLGWFMVRRCDHIERERLGLALILLVGSAVFWALFELQGSAISLFTDRNVQLPAHGFWTVTAPQTQSFNPAFILIFAPVFAALWAKLGRIGKDPNPTAKFGLALLQVGAAFLILVWGARFVDAQYREPLAILVLSYLLQTTGELCLSPIGLSEITKLAPAALISTLMAAWYLSTSWGEWIGGRITQLAGTETVGGQVLDPKAALDTSSHVFGAIGATAAAFGVAFLIATPWLKRWTHRTGAPTPAAAPEPFVAIPAEQG